MDRTGWELAAPKRTPDRFPEVGVFKYDLFLKERTHLGRLAPPFCGIGSPQAPSPDRCMEDTRPPAFEDSPPS